MLCLHFKVLISINLIYVLLVLLRLPTIVIGFLLILIVVISSLASQSVNEVVSLNR